MCLRLQVLNRQNYDIPAPSAALIESYRSNLQVPNADDVKTSTSQPEVGKESSFMNSYPGVFRDFQVDAVQDNLDTLKKYDSFGRWISQAIGVDTGEPMFPLSTDATYWASTATEAPSLVQRMHENSGFISSLPQEKCFSILDYSPSIGSSQSGTKVNTDFSYIHTYIHTYTYIYFIFSSALLLAYFQYHSLAEKRTFILVF